MDKKGKFIFILLNLIFLLSLITIGNVTAEPMLEHETEELYLWLGYDQQPHIHESTGINVDVDSYDKAITFSLELLIDNGTNHTIYYNPSISLDDIQPHFYDYFELTFNKTEYWDIWLIVYTTTGNEYSRHGWLEVSPFDLDLYRDYYAYVNYSTPIDINVYYYDSSEQNASVTVWLDDSEVSSSPKNTSIYHNSSYIFNTSVTTFYDTFNCTIDSTGYYTLWLEVEENDTGKKWYYREDIKVQWVEVNIFADDILLVGNTTKIEFEILSALESPITVDVVLTIRNYYTESWNDSTWNDIPISAGTSDSRTRFNNSIFMTVTEKGEYDVVIEVTDETNNEVVWAGCEFNVYDVIDLRGHPSRYYVNDIEVGWTEYIGLEIYYFETFTTTATIQIFLDDGTTNITLHSDSYSFPARSGFPDHETYHVDLEHTFTEKGWYDVWFIVTIDVTGETLYNYGSFYVHGEDYSGPEFIEISGLTDGNTYSGRIAITAVLTDENWISSVELYVENENYTDYFDFDQEISEYDRITRSRYICYAILELDTDEIYDGQYNLKIIGEDNKGYSTTKQFSVNFENGYIYVPPDEDRDEDYDEEDRITPGFEDFLLILSILILASYSKRRK